MDTLKSRSGLPPGAGRYLGRFTDRDFETRCFTISKDFCKKDELPSTDDGSEFLWIQARGLGSSEKVIQLCKQYNIPTLLQEDILHTSQRPNVEPCPEGILAIVPLPLPGTTGEWEQLGIWVCEGTVVTFFENDWDWTKPLTKRLQENISGIRNRGEHYLFYAILDLVIDLYLDEASDLRVKVDKTESRLLNKDRLDATQIEKIYSLRRKGVAPLARRSPALNDLASQVHKIFQDDKLPGLSAAHVADLTDHIRRLADHCASLNNATNDLLNLYLGLNANKMNQIMTFLTLFTAIFIPLSFIAGLYGMNFDTSKSGNMPELSFAYAYPTCLGVMFILSFAMVCYFRKKKWL